MTNTETQQTGNDPKTTLALLRVDPWGHPMADVCNTCGAMIGDVNAHRRFHNGGNE